MPQSEDDVPPLTAAQLSTLRKRLLAERERIQSSEATLSPVREDEGRQADEMDQAEASIVQHEALGRAAHDQARLAEMDRALARIDAGTYGISELSGEPIGYARLSAVPWARFTVAEQESLERAARR
ncbi:MAG TPA: TraR/DksA family transcriptional regulator [Polyangiaceae bacterium]|nr:TraR/DksA family transcriptional regulator [Polyangiaceae bacterium]